MLSSNQQIENLEKEFFLQVARQSELKAERIYTIFVWVWFFPHAENRNFVCLHSYLLLIKINSVAVIHTYYLAIDFSMKKL